MRTKKFHVLCLGILFLCFWTCASHAEIGGRVQTKRERMAQQSSVRQTHREREGRISVPISDDALYLEALNLLKLNRTEEARQKLRQLESATLNRELKATASASVGDSYYYEKDYSSAYESYKETLRKYPVSDQKDYLRDRLLELSSKFGYTTLQNPPKNFSAFYSVQVGSFSSAKNAQALVGKLSTRGYEAYLASDRSRGMSRVRVGHFSSKVEAAREETRLKREGYPTKIVP